tara:strand:+ start:4449 stop:5396 length:948 start_codon:yes stop_codon:yes gene_type:complete
VPINITDYTIFLTMSLPGTNNNENTLGKAVGGAATNIFNRTLGRLFGAGLKKGAEGVLADGATARWTTRGKNTDWRVKLTLPTNSGLREMFFEDNNKSTTGINYKLLGELSKSGGIIFPITPSVIIQHTASYSQLATTHANYPYYAYQNSEPANMTIVGEFPVQNQTDAAYWVGTIHFLRAVTKMFFGGNDGTRGNPPPILKLNGYGNHVFNNVPVIVTNFTCELRSDVDYISTAQGKKVFDYESEAAIKQDQNPRFDANSQIPETWAPSLSTITVQLQPIYSRDTVKNFSMREFVSGRLSNFGSKGNQEGVGFI